MEHYGSGVTEVARVGAGVYTVSFDQSLTGCVAVGTVGSPGFASDNDTVLHADVGEPNSNSVTVRIFHPAPVAGADNSFSLAVFC